MHALRLRATLAAALFAALCAATTVTLASAAAVSPISSRAAQLDASRRGAPADTAAPVIPDSVRIGALLDFRIEPNPCVGDSIRLVIRDLCPGCVAITGFTINGAAHSTLSVEAASAAACNTMDCFPLEATYGLPPRPAGAGNLFITIHATVPGDSMNLAREVTFQRTLVFVVNDTCGTVPPPPPPGTLPFVTSVTFPGSSAACDTCLPHVCADRPLRVHFTGLLPGTCYSFVGARVLPGMNPSYPPTVELDFRNVCYAPCAWVLVPFEGTVELPIPPMGTRTLAVSVAVNICPDTTVAPVASQSFAFVADSCGNGPPPTCIWPFLEPMGGTRDSFYRCNLVLTAGGVGPIVFGVRTGDVPLAGLQGLLGATPNLHVLRIEPTGVALGMHLLTHTRPDGGIAFALFADSGAPIPANNVWPVLRVIVQADSADAAPTVGYVAGEYTAASDSAGNSLGTCPVMTLVAVQATVCILKRPDCDVNGDGVTNVADLVRMARCWFHPGSCPDSIPGPDCNDDGVFTVADILCCARVILGGSPNDTLHAAPGLRVELGTPTFDGARVHVPLVIHGATAMNGALLHLTFPGERFQIVPPPAPAQGTGAQSTWLPLVEPGNGDAVIGVLRLDDAATDEFTFPLELTLLPGQQPGGVVTVDQGEVIAPDGSGLSVDLSHTWAAIPTGVDGGSGISRIDLLCGPNPANGSTRFVVRLPEGGAVDLAVYDLAGRRVETLWRGPLPAGERAFTWQPAGGRTGVYFARLAVNGVVRTTRVTMQLAR